MSASGSPVVALERVGKRYGDFVAVHDATFAIGRGEFFSMLGPSGCGKTTLLRMIAGFEDPTSGVLRLDGADMAGVPPYRRPVNTVFQSYALFPHLSVFDNVAFGPRTRKEPAAAVERRVRAMLEVVRLGELAGRKPSQLSGGQRQRVALARAIVNEPEVLLLDEPLGALDLKLRQEMQIELKRIQREVGITFVYVTHDQEEALTMSDRIAVMERGNIEQLGTPIEIYERPATEFVAGFIGVSNLIERDGRRLTVRPEKVRLLFDEPAPDGAHVEGGTITEVVYLGVVTRYVVALDGGGDLVAVRQNLENAAADVLESKGRRVQVAWRPDQAYEIANASKREDER